MKTDGQRKKIWSPLIVALLVISLFQSVMAVETDSSIDVVLSEAPINPEYLEYKIKSKEVQKGDLFQMGFVPEPVDTSHLKGKKISKKALEIEMAGIPAPAVDEESIDITLNPASYDLRTLGRVTPVKNQGSCGSCWAFASYSSMESEILPGEILDFSENNLKNLHGFDLGPCAGGNAQIATAYLARWGGAVAEADDPYVASSITSPANLPTIQHSQENLFIPGRSGSLDNDNIKAAVQTTGALYTTMYWSSTYYNPATRGYYYGGTSSSNHAVAIVGWDDAYSRNNFIPAAPGDGAFIIKNSWGTSFGEDGYFYMSYYDSKVGKTLTAFTGESPNNYDRIYQYDPMGWISSMGYGTDTAWAANVFTAEGNEAIGAVGLFTNQVNTNYRIEIHTSPDQGPLNSAGPVTATEGTIGIPGYHTVALPKSVSVTTSQKYSIVVRLQTPNYRYPIAIEKPASGYSSQATAGPGQSFTSSDGIAWSDLTSIKANTNVCIKAFTSFHVAPTLTAAFTASPTTGTVPLTVTFTDQSTGSPTSWSWTFGDGSTSSLQNPTHQYLTAGTYTVSLTAMNSGGSKTITNQDYITVTVPAPKADFTATPTSGMMPLGVQFRDLSTNSPTSWKWTFGDGESSTLQHPLHTYTAAGTYTVSLTATNAGGSNTISRSNLITVTIPPAPKANFTITPSTGTAPLKVQFMDTSTNSPSFWKWTFGDGSSSTEQNPAHQYQNPGTYTVSLTVNNAGGSSTLTKNDLVMVTAPIYRPIANFSATPTAGLAPLTVQFTDTSSNSPSSWLWNFGDGTTSTLQNPIHLYADAGSYPVSLTATNSAGSNTVIMAAYITVTLPPPPIAAFTGTPTNGVAPVTVTFTDQSTNAPTSWSWTFGDGASSILQSPTHQYTSPGTFTVSLTVTNLAGSNSIAKTRYITVTPPVFPPTPDFTADPSTGTSPLTVQFTDSSANSPTSWSWTFGDGASSTQQNPSHAYTSPGTYTVSLTAINSAGSKTVTKQNYITVTMPAPIAGFTAAPTSGCVSLDVQFTDRSTNAPTSWSWNFGDGTTSMVQNPAHQYTSAGTYTVSLTVFNVGGSNTMTQPNFITVTAPVESILVDFTSDIRSGAPPLQVQFTDKTSGSPNSWLWDFGDGAISTSRSPSHEYQNAGMYTVSLTAKNDQTGGVKVKKFYVKVAKQRVKGNEKLNENANENSKNFIQIF